MPCKNVFILLTVKFTGTVSTKLWRSCFTDSNLVKSISSAFEGVLSKIQPLSQFLSLFWTYFICIYSLKINVIICLQLKNINSKYIRKDQIYLTKYFYIICHSVVTTLCSWFFGLQRLHFILNHNIYETELRIIQNQLVY